MWGIDDRGGTLVSVPVTTTAVRLRRLAALAIVLAFGVAAQARADTVTDLGDFVPMGLNDHDQVVGDVMDTNSYDHAALWSGSLQALGQLGSTDESDAYAISDGGRIAGDDYASTSSVHGVYWNGGGTAHQVGPFSGVEDTSDYTVLNGVDTAGDLAGFTPLSSTNYSPAGFVYHGGTEVPVGQADLGGQPGGTGVGAITPDGIHLLGDVTTTSATTYKLWSSANPSGPGTALDITPPRNGALFFDAAEFGTEINNDLASDGTVLGYKGSGSSKQFYVRLPSGSELPVSTANAPPSTGLHLANAVNASHIVAGAIYGPTLSDPLHAAIWANGKVTDLNTLLPPGTTGWDLIEAFAINNNGDIVGVAAHGGKQVGFLLNTSASVSVKFGAIAKLQVGKVVDVPVTVTAGSVDLSSVSLGKGLKASDDHAKVQEQAPGITDFSLSAEQSRTFTFKLKGQSEGNAGLSVTTTASSSRGHVTDSATTFVKVWDPKVQVTQVKEPSERDQGNEILVKYRGLGWDPIGGPIEHTFSGHPLPAHAPAATFEGEIHFTLWPQRTTDHHAIEDHGGGGYCWGELATHQGGLYATTDKIKAKWGGWVLWSATPVLKAHEAWCEGEQYSFLDKAPAPIIVMGLFKDVRPALFGIRVYGARGVGGAVPVRPGHILNFHDADRDVCVSVSLDHNDLITSATHGRCL